MGNRAPGRTSMTVVARELGLKPNAKKDLQKNLRNENHPTTMALKAIGVTYAVTGKGRGAKSEALKQRSKTKAAHRFPSGARVRSFSSCTCLATSPYAFGRNQPS